MASIRKNIKDAVYCPTEARKERGGMRDTTRKSGEQKQNEDGEQTKKGNAPERKKTGTEMESLGERTTRGQKGPRRTVCTAKARAGTKGTGGDKETAGSENRREPKTIRKGLKEDKEQEEERMRKGWDVNYSEEQRGQ